MLNSTLPFDLGGLYRSIDQERSERRLTWAALAREVGVAASTIRRFERAVDAEADGVLALIRWLGVAPEQFVAGTSVVGEPLLPAGDGMVRADVSLVSLVDTASGRVGGRTSIQRLVAAAQADGRSVASLTRRSEF